MITMNLFDKTKIKNYELKNRLVMEPMCMYSAFKHDGIPTYFHFAHYVSRAIGQVGMIIIESTGVAPEGRITDDCLGLYNDAQIAPFKSIVDAVHEEGSIIGVQLNHAGRKSTASDGIDTIYGPSAIAYSNDSRTPVALTTTEIKRIIKDFQDAAVRADKAGFDAIEIHGAHGYLISEFMSPASNHRTDKYKDGSVFLQELTDAITDVWPKHKILSLRVSATDYEPNGQTVDDTIRMLGPVAASYDFINVSSGGITINPPTKIYPGYQVPFALKIKKAFPNNNIIACGMLGNPDLAAYVIESEQADYIGLARPLLSNANWVLHAAHARRKKDLITQQYKRAFK